MAFGGLVAQRREREQERAQARARDEMSSPSIPWNRGTKFRCLLEIEHELANVERTLRRRLRNSDVVWRIMHFDGVDIHGGRSRGDG